MPKLPPSTKNTPPLKPSPEQGTAAETPYQKSPPYTTNTTPTKPLLKQRNQHQTTAKTQKPRATHHRKNHRI
jgi:hypothetical protein